MICSNIFTVLLFCGSFQQSSARKLGSLMMGQSRWSRVKSGTSLGRWGHSHLKKGPLATSSVKALASTMGVVGTIELWRLFKASVSPEDIETHNAIDSMISHLMARKEAPKQTWYATEYPYYAAAGLASMTIISCIIKKIIARSCKTDGTDDKGDSTSIEMVHPSPSSESVSCMTPPADPPGLGRNAATTINIK